MHPQTVQPSFLPTRPSGGTEASRVALSLDGAQDSSGFSLEEAPETPDFPPEEQLQTGNSAVQDIRSLPLAPAHRFGAFGERHGALPPDDVFRIAFQAAALFSGEPPGSGSGVALPDISPRATREAGDPPSAEVALHRRLAVPGGEISAPAAGRGRPPQLSEAAATGGESVIAAARPVASAEAELLLPSVMAADEAGPEFAAAVRAVGAGNVPDVGAPLPAADGRSASPTADGRETARSAHPPEAVPLSPVGTVSNQLRIGSAEGHAAERVDRSAAAQADGQAIPQGAGPLARPGGGDAAAAGIAREAGTGAAGSSAPTGARASATVAPTNPGADTGSTVSPATPASYPAMPPAVGAVAAPPPRHDRVGAASAGVPAEELPERGGDGRSAGRPATEAAIVPQPLPAGSVLSAELVDDSAGISPVTAASGASGGMPAYAGLDAASATSQPTRAAMSERPSPKEFSALARGSSTAKAAGGEAVGRQELLPPEVPEAPVAGMPVATSGTGGDRASQDRSQGHTGDSLSVADMPERREALDPARQVQAAGSAPEGYASGAAERLPTGAPGSVAMDAPMPAPGADRPAAPPAAPGELAGGPSPLPERAVPAQDAGAGDHAALPPESRSAERLAPQAALPRPEAGQQATVLRQLADEIRLHGGRGFEITLHPEELGRLRFDMRPAAEGLSVQITAERPETLDLVRRHLDDLARELRSLGHGAVAFSFGGSGGRQSGRQFAAAEGAVQPDHPAAAVAPAPPRSIAGAGALDLRL